MRRDTLLRRGGARVTIPQCSRGAAGFMPSLAMPRVSAPQRIRCMNEPERACASPPWGRWEVLLDEPAYKVKRIVVHPGKRLSYQRHFRRTEHWVVVEGEAAVTIEGKEVLLRQGDTLFVPREAAHRIANRGAGLLVIIEIQQGDYLHEDDIVRLEDDYGRQRA